MMIRLGLFWSALLLAAGVFLFEKLPPFLLPYGYVLLLLSGGLFLLYGHFRRRFFLVLLGAALSLLTIGAFRMALSDALWQEQSHWASRSAGTYEGIVMEEPLVQKGEEGYARYALALVSIRYADGTLQPLSGTCYLYDQKEIEYFHPGDRLYAEGEMSPIRLYQNPGKIDLTGRYRSRHLLGRLYLTEGMHPAFAGESGAYRVERFSSELKRSLKETFAPYMDPVRLSILMTLLFGGNYNDIPEEVMTSFSATGIIHILSVSGSHVALLFGFLYLLGRWLSLPRRLVILPAILLVLFYAVLSGLVPPVIRAAVMGILSVVGIFLDREKTTLNLLGAAVLGMLLWDPYYMYDVSFQLSVGASAGILLFYRPILHWMSPFRKLPKWVKEGIALSSAAQLLTIPIMLYDFHRFPVYFIFANLFVTPFLEWVIIAGLLAAVISLLCRPLMAGLLYTADYGVFASLRLNMLLSSAKGAQLVTGGLSLVETVFYYALLAAVYFRKRLSIRSRMAAGGILSLLFLAIAAAQLLPPSPRIICPDLGADRGILLVNDGRNILYYKASRISSHTAVWEWNSILAYEGVQEADVLILDLEDVEKPLPFDMGIPVKEIWVTGGDPEKLTPLLMKDTGARVRRPGRAGLALDDMRFATNGSSWRIAMGEKDIVLSGRKPLPKATPHTLWIAGSHGFLEYTEKDVETIAPELVIYGGTRLVHAYEDMELFDFKDIPSVNLYQKGMQEVVYKNGWKLVTSDW